MLEHSSKHQSGIIVTPSGMSIEVRALQPENALSPICLMVDGSVILSKLEHWRKHLSGIIVTPSGMSIEVAYLSSFVLTYSFALICRYSLLLISCSFIISISPPSASTAFLIIIASSIVSHFLRIVGAASSKSLASLRPRLQAF